MNIVIVGVGNIGFSTAARLADRHELVLVDQRAPEPLQALLAGNARIRFVQADASDASQAEAALATCFDGRPIDVLVCTVGTRSNATAMADLAAFERDFDTNVFGNLVPIKAALARMCTSGTGKIVVVSSTSGHHAPKDLTAYAPSKWALEAICAALGSELRERGLAVDVPTPTNLRNRHSDVFTSDFGLDPEGVAELVVGQLEKRGGRSYFIPGSRRAIHTIERLAPALLDLAAGLRPFRQRRHRAARVRTALITGASSGLGRELARLYAPQLQELWIVARTGSALETLREELARQTACRIHVRTLDLGDPDAVDALASELGAVDLLINNAGTRVEGETAATPLSAYHEAYAVNFLAAVRLTAALLAHPAPPVKVVNVLSTTAIAGRRGLGAYSSSKAALWSFTRSLRRVYGDSLQVLEVLPATFESGLFEKGRRTERESAATGPAQAVPAARRLSARQVAERIQVAEAAGRERLFIPLEARLFLVLEALLPPIFRRLFP